MYRPIKMIRRMAIALLAFGGTALGPAAQASTLVQTRSRVVTYHDLDLATARGGRTLLKRIDHAAVKACGGYPDGLDLGPYLRFGACHAQAMAGAVRKINNASVSRLYDRLYDQEIGARTG